MLKTHTANLFLPIAMVAFLSVLTTQAKAELVVEYYESGSDVVLEFSGSLNIDVTAASQFNQSVSGFGNQDLTQDGNSILFSAPIAYGFIGRHEVFSATSPTFWVAGTDDDYSGNSSTGDTLMFRYENNLGPPQMYIWLDYGREYSAGDSISGTMTLGGYSIASSGILDWSADLGSVGSIEIRAAAVPEPSSATIFGSVVGLIAFRRRRK